MAAAAIGTVDKKQLDTESYHYDRKGHLPHHAPVDDVACCKQQQYAYAQADAGADFVVVREECAKAGNDDEQGPPSSGGELETEHAEDVQYPEHAGGDKRKAYKELE